MAAAPLFLWKGEIMAVSFVLARPEDARALSELRRRV